MQQQKAVGKKKNKSPGLFAKLGHWWKRGLKRKGHYVEHQEDHIDSLFAKNDVGDTFSVEEDLESCCQGLLGKDSPPTFDKSPVLSTDGQSSSSCQSSTTGLFPSEPGPRKVTTPSRSCSALSTPPIKYTDEDDNFVRKTTQDSKQASLESVDSLAWSYHEEESFATPRVANTGEFPSVDSTLGEHVHFLRMQTQPRKVELVWKED